MRFHQWFVFIFGIVIIGGLYLLWMFSGLQNIENRGFEITGVENIDINHFTIKGELVLYNPSRVNIPIDSVEYDVILEQTGEIISSGKIGSFILLAGRESVIQIEQKVEWSPSQELSAELSQRYKVLFILDGEVIFKKFNRNPIRFREMYDIKDVFDQIIPLEGTAKVTDLNII